MQRDVHDVRPVVEDALYAIPCKGGKVMMPPGRYSTRVYAFMHLDKGGPPLH